MTCVEKLKELRPHLTDRGIEDYIMDCCPASFGIMENSKDCGSYVLYDECVACWNREIDPRD